MYEPSFLKKALREPDDRSGKDLRRSEFKFRLGVVTDIYPPNHKKNKSKRYTEYMVDVFVMEDAATTKPYPAVVSDTFASASDKFSFTPRITKTDPTKYGITEGSFVAVLCINADTQRALIIGGFPNPNLPVISQDPDEGHHLFFEFNGLMIKINKDGELVLFRKGATNEDGTVKDGYVDNSGAEITLLKDGSVSIRAGTDSKTSIQLDPSRDEINLTCAGNVNVSCKGNVNVNCGTGNGIVVNSGTQSIIKGDMFLQDLTRVLLPIVQTTVAALIAIPATSEIGKQLQRDWNNLQTGTPYLSASKVD